MTERRAGLALAVVIAGSLIVRLWTISERSFWFDEAFAYTLACESTWAELVERTAGDVHPPLSYALLCFWSRLAGTSVVDLRLFSVFWSVMTMVGCYLFCRDALAEPIEDGRHSDPLTGAEGKKWEDRRWRIEDGEVPVPIFQRAVGADEARWIGVSAAALIAACSLHIKWSQEARMYTLGSALVFFSIWMLVRALRARENSRRWWGGYAVCATALTYTHNFGLFSIVAQAVHCVGVLVWQRGGTREDGRWRMEDRVDREEVESTQVEVQTVGHDAGERRGVSPPVGARTANNGAQGMRIAVANRARARYAAIAFLAVGIAYLPWLGSLLSQTQRAAGDYWTPPVTGWTVMNCFGGLVVPTNSSSVDSTTAVVVTVALAIVVLLLAWKGGAAARLLTAMILAPVGCALLVSLASVAVFIDRYFLFAYMFVLCAVPYLAVRLVAARYRTWLIGLLVANSLAGHAIYWSSLDTANRPGIGGAAGYVAERRKPGAVVVVTHPTIYFSARYYLRGITEPLLFVPKGTKPHYMGGPAIPPEWTIDEEGLRNLHRVWVLDIPYAPDGSGRPSLPKEWTPVLKTTATFPEVYRFLADVTAAEYMREGSADRRTGE